MKGTSQENSNRATTLPWSVRMANSVMRRRAPMSAQWHYQNGVILKAIEQVWLKTGDTKYWVFIKETLNQFIDPAGNIRTYSLVEYNFDQVNLGKMLFPAYKQTGDARYKHAVALLREQLRWATPHNRWWILAQAIYPYQMWLEGIYMAGPFYAEFAGTFNDPTAFDNVAHQQGRRSFHHGKR